MTRTATGPRVLGDRAWSRALIVGVRSSRVLETAQVRSGHKKRMAHRSAATVTGDGVPGGSTVVFRTPATVAAEPEPASSHWPWSGWFGGGDPVGSPKWWKKHKKTAEFQVGKGYTVEGVDGYFDGMGRPIDRAVTDTMRAARVTNVRRPECEEQPFRPMFLNARLNHTTTLSGVIRLPRSDAIT